MTMLLKTRHVTVLCAVVGVVVTCIIKWYNYSNSICMPGLQIHVINWCCVNSVIGVYKVLMLVFVPLVLCNEVGINASNGGTGSGAGKGSTSSSQQ